MSGLLSSAKRRVCKTRGEAQRPKLRGLHLLVRLLAVSALPQAAWATTVVLQPVETMTQRSSVIVRAVPIPGSAISMWGPAQRFIVTQTRFEVLETLYGAARPGDQIVVETLGGFIAEEDLGMLVPGAPKFVANEEVVLFLWRPPGTLGAAKRATDAAPLRVLDLSAGKFEITLEAGAEVLTRRDLHSGQVQIIGDPVRIPARMDGLRAAIAEGVKAKRLPRPTLGAVNATPDDSAAAAKEEKRRAREERRIRAQEGE